MNYTVSKAAGSHVVVSVKGLDLYLDARKVGENGTCIEIVRSGQVVHKEGCGNHRAPARIVELMRKGLRP